MHKPTVCIIDSDSELLKTLSVLLDIHDVIVHGFETAESFLEEKIRSSVDCLVVETELPNMGGIEMLEHINQLGMQIPAIVLSTKSDVSTAVRAMKAQAHDFVEKPFIESTLIEKILTVIERK